MSRRWYVLAAGSGFIGLDREGHKTPALAVVPDIGRASPWLGRGQAAEEARRARAILGATCELVAVKFTRDRDRAGRDVTRVERA